MPVLISCIRAAFEVLSSAQCLLYVRVFICLLMFTLHSSHLFSQTACIFSNPIRTPTQVLPAQANAHIHLSLYVRGVIYTFYCDPPPPPPSILLAHQSMACCLISLVHKAFVRVAAQCGAPSCLSPRDWAAWRRSAPFSSSGGGCAERCV